MVYIPPDFEAPIVPELDEAERELDATILAGEHIPEKQQIDKDVIANIPQSSS
jgi:hypothetical protein